MCFRSCTRRFLSGATSLIKAFDRFPELQGGNGSALQRELIDAILSDEDGWWAEQLNSLIDCSKATAAWTAADEAKLERMFAHYRTRGVSSEYDNCDTADAYAGFRDELSTLGEKTGAPFTKTIEEIDQRIAELEPEENERGTSASWKGGGTWSDGREDTDQAIREVFDTLLE